MTTSGWSAAVSLAQVMLYTQVYNALDTLPGSAQFHQINNTSDSYDCAGLVLSGLGSNAIAVTLQPCINSWCHVCNQASQQAINNAGLAYRHQVHMMQVSSLPSRLVLSIGNVGAPL